MGGWTTTSRERIFFLRNRISVVLVTGEKVAIVINCGELDYLQNTKQFRKNS